MPKGTHVRNRTRGWRTEWGNGGTKELLDKTEGKGTKNRVGEDGRKQSGERRTGEAGSVVGDPVRMKLIKYRLNPINEIQEMIALDLEMKI